MPATFHELLLSKQPTWKQRVIQNTILCGVPHALVDLVDFSCGGWLFAILASIAINLVRVLFYAAVGDAAQLTPR